MSSDWVIIEEERSRKPLDEPTESTKLARRMGDQSLKILVEHRRLREECERKVKNHEGVSYFPFDGRSQPGGNTQDAYIETSGFKNKIEPETRLLRRLEQTARDNEEQLLDLRRRKEEHRPKDDGEMVTLDDIKKCEDFDKQLARKLMSTNVAFFIAMWDTARSECSEVTAMSKTFYWYEQRDFTPEEARLRNLSDEDANKYADYMKMPGKTWGNTHIWSLDALSAAEQRQQKQAGGAGELRKRQTIVDIVCDNHRQWIKISNMNNDRLIHALANEGVGTEELLEEEEEDARVLESEDEMGTTVMERIRNGWQPSWLRAVEGDEELLDLLKFAVQFSKAADVNQVLYKPPKIKFVCPKLEEGKNELVDIVLRRVRSMNIEVQTVDRISSRNMPYSMPQPLDTALKRMMPKPQLLLPDTINIDCTILIALVSEITHAKNVAKSEWYAAAINGQIDTERIAPLMEKKLWTVLRGRKLVCTKEAAVRLCDIASKMATPMEKQRTALLIDRWMAKEGREEAKADEIEKMGRRERLEKLRAISELDIPDDFLLPVKIIDDIPDIILRGLQASKDDMLPMYPPSHEHPYLPQAAKKLHLSDINDSVFKYGWATGACTLTSNRANAKGIQLVLDREVHETGKDIPGPLLWITDVARSYITKGAKGSISARRRRALESQLADAQDSNASHEVRATTPPQHLHSKEMGRLRISDSSPPRRQTASGQQDEKVFEAERGN